MAAVTADRVVVELEARLDRYEANVARAEQKFDKAMGGIQKNASATERLVSRAMGGVTAALAGVSAIALARSFLSIADEAKKLDATLKLATAGFGSFGKAQEDVRRIADDTRSGLTETASLYANFVRGAKELGGTQAEAARATETFSKTLKISGADANSAASATLQFGQALASGALRGDELNSILEASPRLARLLADAMGQPIGQIKKLGEEGALTSDKLLKALTDKKFTAGIDSEFKEIPVTFDDAMTKVSNAALITFSAFDRGGEFSKMLADFVTQGADGFDDLERSAEDFGISVRGTLEGLGSAFAPLLDAGREAFRLLGADLSNFSADGRNEIADILGAFDDIRNIGPSIANQFGANGKFDSRMKEDFLKRSNASDARLKGEAAERRFRSSPFISGTDVFGNPLPGTPGAAPGKRSSVPSSGGKTNKGPKSPLDADAFAREEATLNDQLLRLKINETLTAEQRADIELKRIEDSRAAADKDVQNEKRYTQPQRDKIAALNDQVAALEAVRVIYDRDVEIAKRDFELATAGNKAAQDLLESQADIATNRREQYEIERRILLLKQSQERAELERLRDSQNPEDRRIGQAGLVKLDQKQSNEQAALGRQFESPLQKYARRLNESDTADQIEGLVVQELDYVRDGISDAITKRLGIKDPFLAGLLDVFIQEQIMKPLANAFAGASGGGGGGFFGSLISAGASIFGSAGGGETGTGVGFASGGSGTIGGRGGTDANTLSLNGKPFANVSRGETLSVGSKALRGSSGASTVINAPQFNLAGAVITRELYADMERISNQSAARAGSTAYRQSMRDAPASVSRAQRFRTK